LLETIINVFQSNTKIFFFQKTITLHKSNVIIQYSLYSIPKIVFWKCFIDYSRINLLLQSTKSILTSLILYADASSRKLRRSIVWNITKCDIFCNCFNLDGTNTRTIVHYFFLHQMSTELDKDFLIMEMSMDLRGIRTNSW